MKYCSQCGHANEDDALFCVKDGCRLEETLKDSQENKYECQVCEKCGFENAIDMKFCGKCGSVLGEDVKSRKKRNSKSHFKFVWVVLLTIGLGLFGASLLYDDGVSELLDDIEGLFEKEYYFNVNMHHSSEIDMDGETINFSFSKITINIMISIK